MMLRSRSLHTFLQRTAIAALLCLLTALGTAQAQTRWVVDPKGSLAWWQIEPNMNHLWGTSCPQEPSWRPGEGRSGGWSTEEAMNAKTLAHGYSNVSDTIHVPLYPRRRVRFVCSEAIQGQILLPDTARWRGAHGQIVINPRFIVTGENMRDVYEQNAILGVSVYPEIKYTLDSVVDMSRKGDTLRGTAVGTYQLRGVTKPLSAEVKAYPEAGGIRVQSKFGIPVKMLVDDFGVWKRNLGLGVMMGIWKYLYMGVDLLVRSDNQVRIGQ
jgi:polyisoprenoid-binding protein YceI